MYFEYSIMCTLNYWNIVNMHIPSYINPERNLSVDELIEKLIGGCDVLSSQATLTCNTEVDTGVAGILRHVNLLLDTENKNTRRACIEKIGNIAGYLKATVALLEESEPDPDAVFSFVLFAIESQLEYVHRLARMLNGVI